jgi:hypothetical protein
MFLSIAAAPFKLSHPDSSFLHRLRQLYLLQQFLLKNI